MRILQLHSNFIEYEAVEKEIAIAEEPEKKKDRLEEIVVLFTAIEEGDEIIVGVNAFQLEEHQDLERLEVDPAIEKVQHARLANIRAERDHSTVQSLLSRLGSAARGQDNLMPVFITCVENDLTLGEICETLRQVWGEYRPPTWI